MWIGQKKWEWLKGLVGESTSIARDQQERLRGVLNTNEHLVRMVDELTEDRRAFQSKAIKAAAAIREADLLRARVNALELERAALLARLLPGLELQIPQFGKLDVALGHPGTDFDHIPTPDDDSSDPPDEIPLSAVHDRESITDEIGELDEPGLAAGRVVDTRRPPTE